MRKRSEARERRDRDEDDAPPEREFVIAVPSDPANEQVILAAMLVGDDFTCDRILKAAPVDAFHAKPHKILREAIGEARRRNLALDPATLGRLAPEIDLRIVEKLPVSRPDVPDNLDFHLGTLLWDWRRAQATRGPIAALLDLVQDPTADPTRTRAAARQVGTAFDGSEVRHPNLRDPADVVREAMIELRKRIAGEAHYPYGIPGLDEDEHGKRRCRPGAAPGNVTILTGLSGSGKALALDTAIATPSGWSTMGELRPGDEVFDEQGERCAVVHCSPVMRNRECFEVEFSDGAKIVADAEHLWKTISNRERYTAANRSEEGRERKRRRRGSKERRVQVSASLDTYWVGRRLDIPAEGSIRTTAQIAASVMHGKARNHAVVVAGPLVMPIDYLEIDPYLLGLWLGDGASDGAVFYKPDEELVDAFRVDYDVSKGTSKDSCRWNIRGGLRTALRNVGVLGNKHIPMRYLRASIGQRLALLQGLMDTDGSAGKKGDVEFCTCRAELAKGFEELLASLGIKGKGHEADAVLNGRVVGRRWRFTFTTSHTVFRLTRKLVRCKPPARTVHLRRYIVDVRRVTSVPVRCIQVDSPSHLFLAGREMIPTHNSTTAAHAILGIARQRRKVLVGAWEVRAPMTLELLATISLGWSRAKVLDGDLSPAELVTIEERMHVIMPFVVFVENPFKRGSVRAVGRVTNDDYLDVLEGHIEASGCDVVVLDLFDRCLRDRSPHDEQEAIWRVLEFTDALRIHTILVHQQLMKGDHVRADKRPTLEGIKGSSAYVDAGATILAPHLPARWKDVPDDTLEIYGLKQRFGKPFAVEFDWDPDTARISGGRSFTPKDVIEQPNEVFGAPSKRDGFQPKKKAKRF